MYSVTKSFTAVAIGLLAAENQLALDDHIIDFFPEELPAKVHPYLAEMTLRHMLTMQTCHSRTTFILGQSADWVASFFTTLPTYRPGRFFHYDSHTLAALVEKLTGRPLLAYLKEKCLDELAFSPQAHIRTDPSGGALGDKLRGLTTNRCQ